MMRPTRLNFQNIQTVHKTQQRKNKQPNRNWGRRPKQTFFQRRYTDDQQTHKKMLNFANH